MIGIFKLNIRNTKDRDKTLKKFQLYIGHISAIHAPIFKKIIAFYCVFEALSTESIKKHEIFQNFKAP